MTSPGAGPTSLTLLDSARRVGAYRWIEHRLFEVTGAWALDGRSPAVQLHASAMSLQHAWHAELWEDRLALVAWADPQGWTRVTDGVEQALGALAALDDPLERLSGLHRAVLPRLLTAYARHAAVSTPATDAPIVRALELVHRDEVEELLEGEALLETLVAGPDAARRAHDVAARLEGLLASEPTVWRADDDPATISDPESSR